jgi:hypothetical protein
MDRVDLKFTWTRHSVVDEHPKTQPTSADLIRDLERYPEDLKDIRRLQRTSRVPSKMFADVLTNMSPRA